VLELNAPVTNIYEFVAAIDIIGKAKVGLGL